MKSYVLSNAQQAQMGFTHRFEIVLSDLNTIAATSGVVNLIPYLQGQGVTAAAYKLVTNFLGGATSALTLQVGYDGASTDAANGLIAAISVHNASTPIAYGFGTGSAFAANATGYVPLDASGIYTATFTATGANLTALTQGEVHVYLNIVDLRTG